jgi:hypothetical protein
MNMLTAEQHHAESSQRVILSGSEGSNSVQIKSLQDVRSPKDSSASPQNDTAIQNPSKRK